MRSSLPRLPLLLCALVACTRPDIPEPIWEGEHLTYSTTTRLPVCRGSFHRQEQHAVELARLLGFELSDTIHFTRINRRQILKYCKRSGLRVGGCAWTDAPYAFSAGFSVHLHEITHAVAILGGILGPQAFGEGLAEVFSDNALSRSVGPPIAQVLGGDIDDVEAYHTAGRFVRFLIERHDLAAVVEFMRATSFDDELADYAPIFAEVFGEPIEAAMAAFAEYPSCSRVSNRIAVVDCNLPPEPWDGGRLSITADLACERDDVLGPDRERAIYTTRGFEIAEAGSYRLTRSETEGYEWVRIVRCGSCYDPLEVSVPSGSAEVHELTPGRYYAEFTSRQDRPPVAVGLTIERL